MYPHHYFTLFPPFPRENKIFVAMSFEDKVEPRWKNVIEPAIENIKIDGVTLKADRVDTRPSGDSILTEILGGISNDLAVFVDVTALGRHDNHVVHSPNVMYELGMAHAVRLPEEVIVFRSDSGSHSLPFDIANVRINSYGPDSDPAGARQKVTATIIDALKELDLRRNLAVKRAAESLDHTGWLAILEAASIGSLKPPGPVTFNVAFASSARTAAIIRLLEIGALRAEFPEVTPQFIALMAATPSKASLPAELYPRFVITPFGRAIVNYILHLTRATRPENVSTIVELMEAKREEANNET